MSAYDLPGVVGGFAGTWLFLIGMAIAVPAAIRVALSMRQPGDRRLARGLAAGGGVVALAGIVLFWGAQSSRQARLFDRAAPFVGIAAAVLAALVAWRIARRRPAAARPDRPPSSPQRG